MERTSADILRKRLGKLIEGAAASEATISEINRQIAAKLNGAKGIAEQVVHLIQSVPKGSPTHAKAVFAVVELIAAEAKMKGRLTEDFDGYDEDQLLELAAPLLSPEAPADELPESPTDATAQGVADGRFNPPTDCDRPSDADAQPEG